MHQARAGSPNSASRRSASTDSTKRRTNGSRRVIAADGRLTHVEFVRIGSKVPVVLPLMIPGLSPEPWPLLRHPEPEWLAGQMERGLQRLRQMMLQRKRARG